MQNNSMKLQNLLFIGVLFFSLSNVYNQEIKILTYNIKYDNVNDTVNNWNDRKDAMVDLLKNYEPGIIGMQEVLHHQLSYLVEQLPDFESIGVGRDDGKEKGEYSPILFNSKKYRLLNSNTFWLSETPEEISIGWDASMERICTYALFEDLRSGNQFYVFNTHFDHIGTEARKKSVALIVSKIKALNNDHLPVALMGDLNLSPEKAPIQFLKNALSDGQSISQKTFYGPTGTFNGFDHDRILNHRIDYIFVQNFKVLEYTHIDDRMENNKHISDHLPVLARIAMD